MHGLRSESEPKPPCWYLRPRTRRPGGCGGWGDIQIGSIAEGRCPGAVARYITPPQLKNPYLR
jgi:hypothetical protein